MGGLLGLEHLFDPADRTNGSSWELASRKAPR